MAKINTTNQMIREFSRVLDKPQTEATQMPKRYKTWEQARLPVYDQKGKIITTISKACTSTGAAKAAKASDRKTLAILAYDNATASPSDANWRGVAELLRLALPNSKAKAETVETEVPVCGLGGLSYSA